MRLMSSLPQFMGLLVCMASALAATPAPAELRPADRQEIRNVIERQLEAFRRDDGVTAFSFAAPGVRAQFRTPANFMKMVRDSYPAVYRPRAVRILDPAVVGGEIVQAVEVVGPDGTVMMALYTMQHQPDKAWRIAGCRLVPTAGKST